MHELNRCTMNSVDGRFPGITILCKRFHRAMVKMITILYFNVAFKHIINIIFSTISKCNIVLARKFVICLRNVWDFYFIVSYLIFLFLKVKQKH